MLFVAMFAAVYSVVYKQKVRTCEVSEFSALSLSHTF